MKKYFVAAAVMAAFSGASFAQVTTDRFEVSFSGTLSKTANCTIEAANATVPVALGSVNLLDMSAAATVSSNLLFTDCAPNQKISLSAGSAAGQGSAPGRVKTGAGTTAAGVEIEFAVGGAKLALPVDGATYTHVADNATASVANVTVPVESKLVVNGATLGAGTVKSTLTLTAQY